MIRIGIAVVCVLLVGCAQPALQVGDVNAESCGIVLNSIRDSSAAHCFYDSMVDCSPASMDVAYTIPAKSTTYRFTIIGEQGDQCNIQMEAVESTEFGNSGVSVWGQVPHEDKLIVCSLPKQPTNRIKNNDYGYAINLLRGFYQKASENGCRGELVDIWKLDEKRYQAFTSALEQKNPSLCNNMANSNFKSDCQKTITAISQESKGSCDQVLDPEMKAICELQTLFS